jgi:copper ion binding protein
MIKKISSIALVAALLCFAAISALAATKTATIKVEGMKCKNCSASVTKAVQALEGVEKVDVNSDKGVAVVEYDDQKVSEEKIRETINATGFKVVAEQKSN